MDLSIILEELQQNRGYFPREAVEEAIRRREEIVPHLLRSLEEVCAGQIEPAEEESYFLHVYAMYLLAQFREKRAYPLIMQLCTLTIESLDALIGDTITEGLPQIIASVFDGDVGPIKSVVENSSIDEYIRSSALRSLSHLACEGVLKRTYVLNYFAELFRGGLEKEYSHVWDCLASEAVDIYAKTLVDDIREAYESGLLWPGYMHPEEVDRVFAMKEEIVLAQFKKRHGGLIDDVIKEMHSWACFHLSDVSDPKPTDPFNMVSGQLASRTVVRSEVKIGRNAPCPCGSGKKYKRCCGR